MMPGISPSARRAVGERLDPRPDGVEAERHRVLGGGAEAEPARDVALPILEAARVLADLVTLRPRPSGRVQVEKRRLQRLDHRAPHPQEAGATGPAQEFSARGREHVTLDGRDVDRHLSHGLAGVEQVGDAVPRRHASDLRRGIDEAAVGGHVRHRDQLHALVDQPLQRLDRERARLVVRHHHDLGAGPLGDLQEGDDVAGVLGARRQDAVARPELERIECHVPGAGRVLDERDLVGSAIDEAREAAVDALERRLGAICRLVSADLRLEPQVPEHGIEHGLRLQGGARVVEVDHGPAPRRLRAHARDIDHERSPEKRF